MCTSLLVGHLRKPWLCFKDVMGSAHLPSGLVTIPVNIQLMLPVICYFLVFLCIHWRLLVASVSCAKRVMRGFLKLNLMDWGFQLSADHWERLKYCCRGSRSVLKVGTFTTTCLTVILLILIMHDEGQHKTYIKYPNDINIACFSTITSCRGTIRKAWKILNVRSRKYLPCMLFGKNNYPVWVFNLHTIGLHCMPTVLGILMVAGVSPWAKMFTTCLPQCLSRVPQYLCHLFSGENENVTGENIIPSSYSRNRIMKTKVLKQVEHCTEGSSEVPVNAVGKK